MNELIKLAVANVVLAFAIALSGTLSGTMFLSAFKTEWNYTGSNISDFIAGAAMAYAFYFCIRQSFKNSRRVREIIRRK